MTVDVAIIGAGPVGLTLANLLGRRGHRVALLEKQAHPYPFPRAIHFDGETMRAFQATGLAAQILPHTHVGRGMLFKDAAGATLIDWSRDQSIGPMGWHESYRFYQPGLEQVLRDGLDRFANVTLTMGARVTGIDPSPETVTLTMEDGSEVAARYVVGCDGAQSATRQTLGIGLTDLGFFERWLVVDARLTRPRPDLGDYSIQHCDPDAPATYVRGAGDRRRWEMRLDADGPDRFEDADIWARLSRWITSDDAVLERTAAYTFRSCIATEWRRARVFLAGDAAHQTPPFMGQGMCAGIRDAANLSWKLSAVLTGADDALLDSYHSERAPNARAFIEMAVSLGKVINQTAQGQAPSGQIKSIWPALGPGLGPRDGIGGTLAVQPRLTDGRLSDDAARGAFYVLCRDCPASAPLPCFAGAQEWLQTQGLWGVVVRPDGYCLTGLRGPQDMKGAARQVRTLGGQLPLLR